MKACGIIVEYNPFHNGHLHHAKEARKISQAKCLIAVMSGSFLQRGEPAIIDKFHRTKAALNAGIDIVIELPYPYAVQSSTLFAKGSVKTLYNIGVSNICFGSEQGNINPFIQSFNLYKKHFKTYQTELKHFLAQGYAYPAASKYAYEKIGLTTKEIDLSQPNNILGFSYVKTILENRLPIEPLTIRRANSHYHDRTVKDDIASATSIRQKLFEQQSITTDIACTIPDVTKQQLIRYKNEATLWHMWEYYYPLLHYRVMTMTPKELSLIHGVDEGLEYRIKHTAKKATSFTDWISRLKTKRYTWTRLQRICVHILTNTTKEQIKSITENNTIPYIRILGFTKTGRVYLNHIKKHINIPLITQFGRHQHLALMLEERASNTFYSVLPSKQQRKLRKQELHPPIFV